VDAKLQLALRDEMTGLYNRRYALQYLDNLVKTTHSPAVSVTVMMLDLDNFKAINDSHGHAVGDAVICETARRLSRNLRSVDLVARIGGEEFLVVLRDTSRTQASQIARRMCARIDARPFQAGTPAQHISTSISIGVAHYEANGLSSQDLIRLADDALYQSKGAGRNRVTIIPHAA
jgi:two-component system cell cycle response regulator